MKSKTENGADISQEEIVQLARQMWERGGRQTGKDLDYWLQAERELQSGRKRPEAPQTRLKSAAAV